MEFTRYIIADWIKNFLFLKDFRAKSSKYLQEREGRNQKTKQNIYLWYKISGYRKWTLELPAPALSQYV